jgi:tetratricopeptide (TPR) repeat protein
MRFAAMFLLIAGLARAADTDDARAHYEKGLAAFALEHFSEAAEEYEKAFQLKPDPALLYNAAQAHRLAGNNDRAVRLYRNYLRIFGKKAANRDEVTRHIHELEAALESQHRAQSSPPTDVAEPSAPAARKKRPLPSSRRAPAPRAKR